MFVNAFVEENSKESNLELIQLQLVITIDYYQLPLMFMKKQMYLLWF